MSSEPQITYMGNASNYTPLSQEELQSIRSLRGLVAVYVHPGHAMRNGLPDKVNYVFQPDAPMPATLISDQLEGRTALYALCSTENACYQQALAQLAANRFNPELAYHPRNVTTDDRGLDSAPWSAQIDQRTDSVAFMKAEDPYNPVGKPVLVVDTHAGPLVSEIREMLQGAENPCSVRTFYESDLYASIALASQRNNQRIAAVVCEMAKVRPTVIGEDIYSVEDYDPLDGSRAALPKIAVESYLTKHNSFGWTNNRTLITFDRGVSRIDQQQQGIVNITDPLSVATLYTLKDDVAPRRAVLVYGAPAASDEQKSRQQEILRVNRDINEHLRSNVHWPDKQPNQLNPALYSYVKYNKDTSAQNMSQLEGRFDEVHLSVIASLVPSAV